MAELTTVYDVEYVLDAGERLTVTCPDRNVNRDAETMKDATVFQFRDAEGVEHTVFVHRILRIAVTEREVEQA